MYHYRECGLPNVYLRNGYREIETANGRAVSVQNVEGLHEAISRAIINETPYLTGRELRFIRKYLDLTQSAMGTFLGVDEQSIRRWEKIARLPKQGDKGVRLLFRDLKGDGDKLPLPELVERIERAKPLTKHEFRFRPQRAEPWQEDARQAA